MRSPRYDKRLPDGTKVKTRKYGICEVVKYVVQWESTNSTGRRQLVCELSNEKGQALRVTPDYLRTLPVQRGRAA
jgi:hypothetical protein